MNIKSIILIAVAMTGCTTTWQHPDYTSAAATTRAFDVDNSHCELVAAGSVPAGPVYAPEPVSRTTYASGSIQNRQGATTGYYTGRATTTNPNAVASGAVSGVSIGNSIAARFTRGEIYDDCMRARGWHDNEQDAWAADYEKSQKEGKRAREKLKNAAPGTIGAYWRDEVNSRNK